MNQVMSDVKIAKNELLEAVKTNLAQHQGDVKEALQDRRIAMRTYFVEEISLIDDVDPNEAEKYYQPEVNKYFPLPEDNSHHYKKAIRMIEMTQDKVIELNENQFDQLIMDNWGFKHDLMATRSFYGK